MDKYFELRIEINPNAEEIVSNLCFENFSCDGVILAEESYKDLEMTSTTRGFLKVFIHNDIPHCEIETTDELMNLRIICEDVLQRNRKILLSRGFTEEELGSWKFQVFEIKNEDWSKKWKEHWTVTKVTERITVVPTWIEYKKQRDDEVIILLDPGCAFGTGTHQTTQLCMKALEKYMPENAKVADIGMGSGILAICAQKLGAKIAYGCDNDETVIEVAKENAKLNDVETVFELNTADKITEKYDFVCANILHNVLFDIMGDLKAIMKDDAKMVLSGILDEKKAIVLEAIANHKLKIIEEMHQDQWTAFVVEK